MRISTGAFTDGGRIPSKYTCDGDDINPELSIEDIPDGAKSLALLVEDPDSQKNPWVHWVLFDIPVTNRIPEHSKPGKQGANDFGQSAYGGPCPSKGTHHYQFRVFALDKELKLPGGTTRKDVLKAMEGHVLDSAELVGVYSRQ